MHLTEYISDVLKSPPVEMDDVTEIFLQAIWEGHTSAYQLCKELNKTRQPELPEEFASLYKIAYKNVHQRLQKLYQTGLIEEIKPEGGYKHGARNFRLATRGLITLLSDPDHSLTRYGLDSENIIVKTFIHPLFSKYTLRHCTYTLMMLLENYLKECCEKSMYFLNPYRMGLYAGPDDLAAILEFQLKWHMRSFIFKIAMLNDDSVHWFKYDKDSMIKRGLSCNFECKADDEKQTIDLLTADNKFMSSLKKIEKEFNVGYSRFKH